LRAAGRRQGGLGFAQPVMLFGVGGQHALTSGMPTHGCSLLRQIHQKAPQHADFQNNFVP